MDLVATVDLRPLPVTTAPARRLPQLLGGLALYGTSMAMQVRATLGLDPWDVFHQGLARHLPLSFGLVTAVTGVAVLLLWIPLRQRPGIGTVANVIVIAVSVDAALALIPEPTGLPGPRGAAGRRASCSTASPPRPTSAPGSGPARATG